MPSWCTALTVSPLDFLYGGGKSVSDISGHFRPFSRFLSLTALMLHVQVIDRVLYSYALLLLSQHFAVLANVSMKVRASIIARTGWVT